MKVFTNMRNGLKPLAIFLNSSILDVWLGSKYTSEVCFLRNFLTKHISEISGHI